MRDGGEYLDSLSKALIPHKSFKIWGDLAGRRNKRERGRILGYFKDYWEVVGGGRAQVGFTLPGRYSASMQGVTLSSIAPVIGALTKRGSHKKEAKCPPSLARTQPGRPTGQRKVGCMGQPAYVCVERSSGSLSHTGS
jgi:hypothetical protein